ncbi:cell division protein FtsI [bacteria symbiont BFo1 of Frankliniella occidentalis]|jgi:cell division protein FtsI (penicillin-binding protein 3)|uniref:peptidoglycan glycosyltransferase FtsI n=1 Tax=Erwinia TaxID=551 RepID=UPI0006647D1E|nr:peptidoglycan glycosyltransferase FtsI [uncultured Erwinia sp.]KMV72175.1 cell division protein FtsI [bacteria symbiont BFo1 of Frankliniella occidentalis]MBN1084692.1 peptidoglycan glycosyltransferase FtsI [Erwinia aphidicola]PIJ58860.1 peptidoglycan glycosyltransferase FtsI [Erwinia sp. OLMDLW33]KYP86247.1 cell division protein FtsI [bacteria symbiont BFo1 of Frankliniella occidentalis]KYP91849.1 cell division protein FtsI [bacteria symbiont BFo1 of Frankliniella occidentalis]
MRAANKTQKSKRTEDQASFVSWRFALLCGCIFLALAGLLLRVAYLQVINPDRLVREGDMRSLRVQAVPTSRGMISDRAGRPLAVSVPVNAIWADPKELHDKGGITLDSRWKALSDALSIPLDQLAARVNANPNGRFVYLARQVNPAIGDYVKKLKLPGIFLREESRRYYPAGQVTSHLIGFTNIDGQGIEGVEKSFDKWLTGQPGERTVRKDRNGRVIEDISSVDSQAAHNLALSIDERLQAQVYRELNNAVAFNKAESGTAVLVDVNTGEVLAMANSPAYNPNNLSGTTKDVMRNRAITDIFEPGSTVKPMVVMTALQRGVVREGSVLNTVPYRINGHEIKDVARYSELTLTGVLQKSSNVGVSRLALAMPSNALVDTYSRFGFGKATNLGLVGESSGIYPQKQRWSDIERATFSFGYGLMVTPLQLARVYATMGSYGIYRPLSITKVDPPVAGQRVFPEPLVRTVLHMMESVALPGGGGVKAAIKGYRIAIKTGTAKKVGPDGKYVNKYIAYTAGVAPASNPRFALVVVINDPQAGKYYGGAVSAPVFGAIMGSVLRTMNVEPDAIPTSDKSEMVTNKNEGSSDRS